MDVVQPAPTNWSRCDAARTASGHEPGDELATVLAARRASEGAVLTLQKAAGVDHHGHEKFSLPLREAEARQRRHTILGDAVGRAVARKLVRRHRNSSMPRRRGTARPPPPRDPTT